ncbi:HD domain-containing protein [Vallitalea sp.]|jgi:hypothetical protein|uniref:HD domain-containing protein n=1 Tax=Vallitalea sp. TaxID=1882829 RepID=UPI0025D27D6C|nr:HD domain-containing protein [Vallitalea sp.]MCT4686795.1 HD domain-containing protein [Vallitalea sp.]
MEQLKNNLLYVKLQERESKFISMIEDTYRYSKDMLPKMNNIFNNYTEHGIDHSLRVLEYMSELINDIDALSDLEITMIIYAALLHDIGMVVSDLEINQLKSSDKNETGMKYSLIYTEYKDEKSTLQECFRPIHGLRAGKHIRNMKKQSLFCIPETEGISFADDIADICASHTESNEWLKLPTC